MSYRNALRGIFVLVLSVVIVAPTFAAGTFTQSGSAVSHKPSGVVFPAMVGGFQRISPRLYDRSGRDVSMRYLLSNSVIADVYVYPVTRETGDLGSEFRRQQSAIAQVNRKVKLLSTSDQRVRQEGRALPAKQATYNLERAFFKKSALKTESQLLVVRDGRWFVAYRFSYPHAQAAALRKPVADFIARWTWKPKGRIT